MNMYGQGENVKAELVENKVHTYYTVSTPDGRLHVSHITYGGENGIEEVMTTTEAKRADRIVSIDVANKVAAIVGGGIVAKHTIATIVTHQVDYI